MQSTHDAAIPSSPVATPAFNSEYGPDARAITVDRHMTRSAAHARGNDEATANAEADKIPPRKRRRAQNDIIGSNVKKVSPAPPRTATSGKPRRISIQVPAAKTGGTFRGPGRKEKTPAPDFNDERFTNISEQLRREIANYNLTKGFQDAWKVGDGLRGLHLGTAKVDTSLSRVQALQHEIQHCDLPDAKYYGLPTLSTIKQRFHMVQLMAEYQKAAAANHKGDKSGILKTFQRKIYAEQSSEQRRKSWDYFNRTAWPLFKAVERYGYGVLIFPLHNVTMKR